MTSGETLLKLTDYPFSYSIIGIISGIIGFGISDNYLVFLGIAGAFGTFLTIIDPIGGLVRKNAENRIKKGLDHPKNTPQELEMEYKISALKSKSINFEIEKIIGLFYFISILTFFLIAILIPSPFAEKLVIKDSSGVTMMNEVYFKLIYSGLTVIALGALISKVNRFWKDLDGKIIIAGYHQIVINNDNATQTSVESMTRAVEQNDWGLAKIWKTKIENEIKYKKGKREIVIKAADFIFRPLHIESSEFVNQLKYRNETKQNMDFKTPQWDTIKQQSLQSIIEDPQLRCRIENFYKMMSDYNDLSNNLLREMNKIINKTFSEEFDKDISGVSFYLDELDSGNDIQLSSCALFEIHPMNFHSGQNTFGGYKLKTKLNNKISYSNHIDQSSFDATWGKILDDVKKNEMMIKIKKYLKDLDIENNKLMKIYSENIGMQLNV